MKVIVKKTFISFVAFVTIFNYAPIAIATELKDTNSEDIDVRKDDNTDSDDDEQDIDAGKESDKEDDTKTSEEDEENARRESSDEDEDESTEPSESEGPEEIDSEKLDSEKEENEKLEDADNELVEEEAVFALTFGEADQDVITLQENLQTLGFMVDQELTGVFDEVTEAEVTAFQEYYGLNVSGLADEETLAKIEEILASPLQKGQRHEDAIQLKEDLALLGFHVSNNPTTLYGAITETKVMEFQEEFNLRVSGIADEVTLETLEEAVEEVVFHISIRDDAVITLKNNLSMIGFHISDNPTTFYGPVTEQTVREFQEYYGLNVTGAADEATLEKIEDILASPFRVGNRHEDNVTLKENLSTLGHHVSDNPTTFYGSLTEGAVKDFQARHGLVVNGIADSVTLAKMEEQLNTPLSVGVFRTDVIDLKVNLEKIGFGVSNNPTVYYGPITERTVKEFQEYYGLEVTGIAGEATLEKIEEVLASVFQLGGKHEDIISFKENLSKLGHHISDNLTSLYDSHTVSAVKDFQARHGLVVNGIADSVTLAKMEEQLNAPLSIGVFRTDVIDLKVNLEKIGFGVSNNPTVYFGPITEHTVSEFQEYYGLEVTGIADEVTLAKMEEILSSPLRFGEHHDDAIQLKEDLAVIGFHISNNPTTYYGTQTEKAVRNFQELYGLRVNGIADEVTLAKITYLLENPESIILQEEEELITYTQYNLTLNEAINRQFQLNPPPQTDKYRNAPAYIHSSLVDIIDRGVITGSSVNIRTQPTLSDNVHSTVGSGTVVEIVREVTGDSVGGNTTWYEIILNGNTLYVHSSLASSSEVAVVNTLSNIREGTNNSSHSFGTVSKNRELTILTEVKGSTINGNDVWYEVRFSAWRNAKKEDVMPFIDPNKNDKFQHLLLDSTAGVSVAQLNSVLSGRGILDGLGGAFFEAGKKHSVNEIYLIAHAILETGHGTSGLATGIEVGRNSSGNLVLATSTNRSSLTDIRTTHNMFGIGANDSDPYRLGAIYAYNAGWFTPEAAVIGGAAFISNSYLQRGQNTLYKMRWNHLYTNSWGGFPQYATDMEWATKQVPRIKNLYEQLETPVLRFDIVQYK